MGLVDRIERKLEATVGDAFARVFGGSIVPQEVEAMLRREADVGTREVAGGRILAPNDYIITLSVPDYQKVSADPDLTSTTFAKHLGDYIHEHGWQTYGDVVVRFEQSANLHTGQFRARGAINPDSTTGEPAPAQRDRVSTAEPGVPPMTDNPSYRGGQGQGRPGDDYYDERYGRQDEPRGQDEPRRQTNPAARTNPGATTPWPGIPRPLSPAGTGWLPTAGRARLPAPPGLPRPGRLPRPGLPAAVVRAAPDRRIRPALRRRIRAGLPPGARRVRPAAKRPARLRRLRLRPSAPSQSPRRRLWSRRAPPGLPGSGRLSGTGRIRRRPVRAPGIRATRLRTLRRARRRRLRRARIRRARRTRV